jgi:hypothetical protein
VMIDVADHPRITGVMIELSTPVTGSCVVPVWFQPVRTFYTSSSRAPAGARDGAASWHARQLTPVNLRG